MIPRSLVIAALCWGSIVSAADDLKVETVRSELHGPSGIAIRPMPGADSYEIYVALAGAGKIVRLESGKPNASAEAITGFIASTDEDDLGRLPGPHGLLFLDTNRLVVAGSEGEGRPFVRLYEFTDQKKPLTAEQYEQQASIAAGEQPSGGDVSSFVCLARSAANDLVPDFLILRAIANDGSSIVWRLPVRSGTLGDLSLLGKNQPPAAPVAIAVEPRGYIVVVRSDDLNGSKTSHMEFVHPVDGRTVVKLPANLPDIVGMAYSPRSGNLYALRRSAGDENRSGVYRIDAGELADASNSAATATLIAAVRRPSALAFGPDGALYVTSLGEPVRGSGKVGEMLRIRGSL